MSEKGDSEIPLQSLPSYPKAMSSWKQQHIGSQCHVKKYLFVIEGCGLGCRLSHQQLQGRESPGVGKNWENALSSCCGAPGPYHSTCQSTRDHQPTSWPVLFAYTYFGRDKGRGALASCDEHAREGGKLRLQCQGWKRCNPLQRGKWGELIQWNSHSWQNAQFTLREDHKMSWLINLLI